MMSGGLLGLSCLLVVGVQEGVPSEQWLSRTRHVKLLVVVETELARALGSEVRPYTLALLAAVERLYRHPSLGSDVRLPVVWLEVLWDEERGPRVGSDARQTLYEFCGWQRDRRARGDWAETPYDVALLLTRQNLCQENNCESLGLGHIGTACEENGGQNCAVVQDIGLQSSFTIAHEIADCLLNKPSVSLTESVPLAGITYDRDVQCQLTFGSGYQAQPKRDPCPVLWCMAWHQGNWHHASKHLPAADGTPCGIESVCLRGNCTHNWKQLTPVDGSWGSWGPWRSCSRSCGGGVRFSRRRCDNPVPANFGKFCVGKRETFQSCNLKACPDNGGLSFRREQCEEKNGLSPEGILQEWEPYYHGIRWADLCKLNCLLKGTSRVNVFSVKVKDGTQCFPYSKAVCVRSQCVKTGCDGLIGSRKRYSSCGVCGGLEANCKRVVRHYHSKVMNYSEVGVIPRGAANLKVHQQPRKIPFQLSAYLVLQQEDGSFALNGGGQISGFPVLVEAGGVALQYSGWSSRREGLRALTRAPLSQELRLTVYSLGSRRTVRITYSYYLHRRRMQGEEVRGVAGAPAGKLRPEPNPVLRPHPSPVSRLHTTPVSKLDTSPVHKPDPTSLPRPDVTSVPKWDTITVPRPDITSAPKPDPTSVLKWDAITVLRIDITSVPKPDPTSVLKWDAITVPRPDITSVPKQDAITVPRPDITSVPKQDAITVPRPDLTSVPKPEHTHASSQQSSLSLQEQPTPIPTGDFPCSPSQEPLPVPTQDFSAVLTLAPVPLPTMGPTSASWQTGPWQFCSVSCGVGWVSRRVVCTDEAGRQVKGCNQEQKPHSMALCVRGSCSRGKG